ncbi:hypothetical protein CEXT_465861 [Caerostris extrusa]|uniref:Uncharacterized protein n=1 Tax=Caerostris extrusa TaxID=172846 RepID=A0AAV4PT12_CAEEX|nr:hypothetical protein CEXT_465861 [Caerostris extrusa]
MEDGCSRLGGKMGRLLLWWSPSNVQDELKKRRNAKFRTKDFLRRRETQKRYIQKRKKKKKKTVTSHEARKLDKETPLQKNADLFLRCARREEIDGVLQRLSGPLSTPK